MSIEARANATVNVRCFFDLGLSERTSKGARGSRMELFHAAFKSTDVTDAVRVKTQHRREYIQAMILPTCAYAIRVAWLSVRLPMACSNTTTSFRRLSTPHKASAPMMALSCVVTKPLWLSPRSWYASWARNVKATVIPMQLPVQVHPCVRSFKKHQFTSNERQAYARGDLSTPKLCRTPCSRESKPVRLLKRADVQRQSRP